MLYLPRGLLAALFVVPGLIFMSACRPLQVAASPIEKPAAAALRFTSLGAVRGGLGRYGTQAWLGIAYALPPVGELRWRAPRPTLAWSGVREAIRFKPPCPQFGSPISGTVTDSDEVTGQEDCLTLNIYAPAMEPKDVPVAQGRLPVMVWIHGGGNSLGSAGFYEPGHLASSQNLIVVTTQYRLGPLGWFSHRALRETSRGDDDKSGNFGTLDLIEALRWVRGNIAAFGGDPDNVTVIGESAGAENAVSLLLAPSAKGLFHRAILQSVPFLNVSPIEAEAFADAAPAGHRDSSNEILVRLFLKEGRARTREEAKRKLLASSAGVLAQYLRSKSPEQLLRSYDRALLGMLDAPLVFRDGKVLPAEPWLERLASKDGWNQVPVLLGTNADEMKLFLFGDSKHTYKLLGILPRYRDEPNYQATSDVMSRAWRLAGAQLPADALRRSGESNVYVYRFDWRGEPRLFGTDLAGMVGAAHGIEIPFVFGRFEDPAMHLLFSSDHRHQDEALSGAIRGYWAEFARTGSPGGGNSAHLPFWPAWDLNFPAYLVLDSTDTGGIRTSQELVNPDRLFSDAHADPRLPTLRDRCRVFHELARWGGSAGHSAYSRAGCERFAFDGYPWNGPTR